MPRSVTSTRRSSPERTVGPLEVFPEIADRLHALVVRSADREAALHLAGEFLGGGSRALTDDQEVVGLPSEALGLEADLGITVSIRMGGMPRTSSCASQYAATCCSKDVPAPPVDAGLETRPVFERPVAAAWFSCKVIASAHSLSGLFQFRP